MTTIKVNNKTITIANKSNESLSFESLDKESKSLESLALNIEKSIEALNIVSNIKAIESFGYKSTEGVGKKIKAGVIAVKNKLIEWFKKLIEWLKSIRSFISEKLFKKKISKIKDPNTKAKMTEIAKDTEKLSTKMEQESNKIIAIIDGKEVEVSEDIQDIKLKQKACNSTQELLNAIIKTSNQMVDEILKPVENEMDESFDRVNDVMKKHDAAMDKLRKTQKDVMKEFDAVMNNPDPIDIANMDKNNPGLRDEILDILKWD